MFRKYFLELSGAKVVLSNSIQTETEVIVDNTAYLKIIIVFYSAFFSNLNFGLIVECFLIVHV